MDNLAGYTWVDSETLLAKITRARQERIAWAQRKKEKCLAELPGIIHKHNEELRACNWFDKFFNYYLYLDRVEPVPSKDELEAMWQTTAAYSLAMKWSIAYTKWDIEYKGKSWFDAMDKLERVINGGQDKVLVSVEVLAAIENWGK